MLWSAGLADHWWGFATFFIGEYLERPEEQKSIWKAGVAVSYFLSLVHKNSPSNVFILFVMRGSLAEYTNATIFIIMLKRVQG